MGIKGIVSRDFEVCFLVPLDSSDIATPAGTGSLFKIKSISCQIFYFSGPGASSFRSERILAQRVTRAHFVTPVREQQRNGVQNGLQRNNKYSYDRELAPVREQIGVSLPYWNSLLMA
jgi:hypothetical protein